MLLTYWCFFFTFRNFSL